MGPSPKADLERFLAEDIGTGDITSDLLAKKKISARIISREAGVAAGTRYAGEIFALRGCKVEHAIEDGQRFRPNVEIMRIRGKPQEIFACERTALNLLSRMSGIATATRELVRSVPETVKVLATRKTAPGLRRFDKDAVEAGGGWRHRESLDSAILIKDNHVAIAGSIPEIITAAKQKHATVEIEVDIQRDAILAAKAGADIILLDNFTPKRITRTIQALERKGLRERIKIEASGGITSENIGEFACTGVDAVSVGALTNSVRGIDFSLEV